MEINGVEELCKNDRLMDCQNSGNSSRGAITKANKRGPLEEFYYVSILLLNSVIINPTIGLNNKDQKIDCLYPIFLFLPMYSAIKCA